MDDYLMNILITRHVEACVAAEKPQDFPPTPHPEQRSGEMISVPHPKGLSLASQFHNPLELLGFFR